MQPVQGPVNGVSGDPPRNRADAAWHPANRGNPLTPSQRTAIERLIVKIMALGNSKAPEIWAALRHQLNIPGEDELTAEHFPQAEAFLQGRLDQAQQTHASRQLMQQLTDLLPQGNNRQAVSDYIRREFGHTVLSQLEPEQLLQVVELLQHGRLDIPSPQQAAISDRTLLPAEHNSLSQQIIRLAAATGESPADIRQNLMTMMGLKAGDPIPARHFPLLMQYLQGNVTLSQHPAPTLATLQAALKHPVSSDERQAMESYVLEHFDIAGQSALTPAQVTAVLQFLFISRLARTHSQHQTSDPRLLQPALNPLIATEPVEKFPGLAKSRWTVALAALAVLVLLWLLI
ncbi:flagella biosynthesis regulator Flk [Martelella alba]|uniref:Flagella biosynthesis regulator Flk n=1 Tax=Martelella alba TaxID=2590451 RepID=A0ABY2SIT4_9HYPH|nr:flagella biosynthesis regulator Flk [Martelella alba]TKI03848.1 flagella biosynthesis regulator Flk [Martelella alba]